MAASAIVIFMVLCLFTNINAQCQATAHPFSSTCGGISILYPFTVGGQCITAAESGQECAYTVICTSDSIFVTIYNSPDSCEQNLIRSETNLVAGSTGCTGFNTCNYPSASATFTLTQFDACCPSISVLNNTQKEPALIKKEQETHIMA